MAFHVILLAPGLSDLDATRAVGSAPSFVSAPASYPDLLAEAEFDEIEEVDLTDQYLATAVAWLNESARAKEELERIVGIEEFRSGQQEREEAVAAIDGGLLKRALFAARAG